MKRILLVKTSSMGDVIHTFPALTDALATRPDLEVDWCVEAPLAGLALLHPGVRKVHTVAVRRWRRSLLSADTRREISAFRTAVRGEDYDLVIDAQGLMKSAVLDRLVGAPVAGLDFSSVREPAAALVYSARHRVGKSRHAIDRMRTLFGRILGYEPDLETIDYGLSQHKPAAHDSSVFLLHGTSWPSKHWHLPGWTELASGLVARGLTPVVTHSGPEERRVAGAIAEAVTETRIVAHDDLAGLAAAMAGSAAAVGTDTGLTHLACALGLPTVQIALSTAPELTGPRGVRVGVTAADIDCAPCRKRDCPLVPPGSVQPCAPTVRVAQILETLDELTADRATLPAAAPDGSIICSGAVQYDPELL